MNSTALYAGTFDPVTKGHTDLVERAALVFGKVIVAIAESPHKTPLFDLAQRISMARNTLAGLQNVEVMGFDNLLIEFAHQQDANVLLRGLRAVSDFDYEFQLASMNRHLNGQIETLFMTPDEKYGFISSSLVKEISRLGGDVSSFVSAEVAQALKDHYGR